MLPTAVYQNRVEPAVGDWFYVVPESDSVVAEVMEVTEASHNGFSCGEYRFTSTGSFGHVGRNVYANAYSSLAAYWAVTLIPKLGWRVHELRRDVFTRLYTNARIAPHLKRTAYLQIDHRDDCLILNGHYLGEGQNMLAEASESFSVVQNDASVASKIRTFLDYADAIIRASYAMNVTRESALGRASQIQSYSNFERGME
jgi:hypothetical protein